MAYRQLTSYGRRGMVCGAILQSFNRPLLTQRTRALAVFTSRLKGFVGVFGGAVHSGQRTACGRRHETYIADRRSMQALRISNARCRIIVGEWETRRCRLRGSEGGEIRRRFSTKFARGNVHKARIPEGVCRI